MGDPNLEERVRRYVADLFCDGDLTRITAIGRFEAGNRHHVHRVTYRDVAGVGTNVVTRVSLVDTDAERAQAARESAVLEALGAGVAPRLFDFDRAAERFGTPAMCIEFIQGDERDLASATTADMERLGRTLAVVHDTEMSDELSASLGGARSISEYVEERIVLVDSYWPRVRRPLPRAARDLVERARPLVATLLDSAMSAECFRRDEQLGLLHGDVGPGNVIWADRPVLVDWEYARVGDPADELAYIFGQHALAQGSRRALWSGYAAAKKVALLDDILERIRWWEPITMFASALWWLERWSRRADADDEGITDPTAAKSQSYYLHNAIARLERMPPDEPQSDAGAR